MQITIDSKNIVAHRGLVVCLVTFDGEFGTHGITLPKPITKQALLEAVKAKYAELEQDATDVAAARAALSDVLGKAIDPDKE